MATTKETQAKAKVALLQQIDNAQNQGGASGATVVSKSAEEIKKAALAAINAVVRKGS